MDPTTTSPPPPFHHHQPKSTTYRRHQYHYDLGAPGERRPLVAPTRTPSPLPSNPTRNTHIFTCEPVWPRPSALRSTRALRAWPLILEPPRPLPTSPPLRSETMEDYVSESDSDYTSYWRDWVSQGHRWWCPWKTAFLARVQRQYAHRWNS